MNPRVNTYGRVSAPHKDRWVFGDRVTGAHLRKFSWTKIVRHQMVAGTSSPDDPSLTAYWSERRRKGPPPPLDAFSLRMLKIQAGRCPLCGDLLLHAGHQPQHPREWERWAMVTRRAITRHSLAIDRGRPLPVRNIYWEL